MKTRTFYLFVLIFTLTIRMDVYAQSSNSILSDTIPSQVAGLRQTQNTVVNFDVSKLSSLIAACSSRGIQSVQFIFAKIRAQDTATYFARHPRVAQAYHWQMVNKATLLIKIPRSAFNLALNDDPQNNSLVQKMKGGGFPLVENNQIPSAADAYLYFDAGEICPRADDCNSSILQQ